VPQPGSANGDLQFMIAPVSLSHSVADGVGRVPGRVARLRRSRISSAPCGVVARRTAQSSRPAMRSSGLIGFGVAQAGMAFGLLLLSLVPAQGAARAAGAAGSGVVSAGLRAGAVAIDITPRRFPVIVNGGVMAKSADKAFDPLFARALVFDDGLTRLALCVVDSCLMPRELLDAAKAAASRSTGIPTERMMVSATHTHAAPSVAPALGTPSDPAYPAFLQAKIAEAIIAANGRLEPARVGWAAVDAWEQTYSRRWILRPDRMQRDPFGQPSGRARMHPGYENPDALGPSGPVDPALSLISVQTRAGRPLALLANFSMHYMGAPALSSDFFGRFAAGVGRWIGAGDDAGFVGVMSQGTSGDLQWGDYSRPRTPNDLDGYAESLMRRVAAVYPEIRHDEAITLAMAEARVSLRRRVPDEARLAWARPLVAALAGRPPRTREDVYAQEQLYLHAEPVRELKLQAVRIGAIGLTAMPNEVFGLTGLKLKAWSPLPATFNVSLANGADGYIPPPEQHALGGYTTWPARTAGLEVQAEPVIVEKVLSLLELVSGQPRRRPPETHGPYARAVLAAEPLAYWRMEELRPPVAVDATGQGRHARYEGGVAHYLPGVQAASDHVAAAPERPSAFSGGNINRAAHLAGGWLRADLPAPGERYSVEIWFWNALAADARPITGFLYSRAGDGPTAGEHLAIGGAGDGEHANRLVFYGGGDGRQRLTGRTPLGLRRWHHVVIVRDGAFVRIHLDGNPAPEITGTAERVGSGSVAALTIGSRSDGVASFEGRLDEVAVYGRALAPETIAAHCKASGRIDTRLRTTANAPTR